MSEVFVDINNTKKERRITQNAIRNAIEEHYRKIFPERRVNAIRRNGVWYAVLERIKICFPST
jgi:hypothetical protein